MHTPVRIIVILMFFVLLAGGIYGTYQVEEKFETKTLGVDGSSFVLFFDAREEHFPDGTQINVINDDASFNYTSKKNQDDISDLSNICIRNSYVQDITINWMFAFKKWCNDTNSICVGSTFYSNLNKFLMLHPQYNVDIHFNSKGSIAASRIVCWDKDYQPNSWHFRTESMLELREQLKREANLDVYAVNFVYFLNEQVSIIREDTIRNLLICGLVIVIITTPYLVHPVVILLVFGGFVALVLELFGLMAAWGVPLNSISMITSIMAIGFSVDYSAHIAHAYIISEKETPEARITHAMGSIGASVLMGGTDLSRDVSGTPTKI